MANMDLHIVGELWGLNNCFEKYNGLKWDRFFILHNFEHLWSDESVFTMDTFTEANKLGCPVYCLDYLPKISNRRSYDIVSISKHFGTSYFLGTPSLMLMQALYEHDMGDEIEEICSWGMDFNDDIHAQQEASWAFWISRILERGIRLSGSTCHFMTNEDNDIGLQGVKEQVGQMIWGNNDTTTGK